MKHILAHLIIGVMIVGVEGCGNGHDEQRGPTATNKPCESRPSNSCSESKLDKTTEFEWKVSDKVEGDEVVQVATLTRVKSAAEMDLVIPAEEKGVCVVGVGDGAFAAVSGKVRKIVLPSSVRHIGSSAFAGCKLIEEVELPEGVETIGENCFDGCVKLRTIHIPRTVSMFSGNEIGKCVGVKNLEIPSANNTSVKIEGLDLLEQIQVYGNGRQNDGTFYSVDWTLEKCPQLSSIVLPGDIGSVQIVGIEKCPKLFGLERWKEGMPVESVFGIEMRNASVVGLSNLLDSFRSLAQSLTIDDVKKDSKKIKAYTAAFSNAVAIVHSDISKLRKEFGFGSGQIHFVITKAYGDPLGGREKTFSDYLSCPGFSPFTPLTDNGRDFIIGNVVGLLRARMSIEALRTAAVSQLKEWDAHKYEEKFRFSEGFMSTTNYCVVSDLALGTLRDWFKSWVLKNGYEMGVGCDGNMIAYCPDKTRIEVAFENYGRGEKVGINQITMMYAVDSGENTKDKIRQRVKERLSSDEWVVSQDPDGHLRAEHWLAGFYEDHACYGGIDYMTYQFGVIPGSEAERRADYLKTKKRARATAEMIRQDEERKRKNDHKQNACVIEADTKGANRSVISSTAGSDISKGSLQGNSASVGQSRGDAQKPSERVSMMSQGASSGKRRDDETRLQGVEDMKQKDGKGGPNAGVSVDNVAVQKSDAKPIGNMLIVSTTNVTDSVKQLGAGLKNVFGF